MIKAIVLITTIFYTILICVTAAIAGVAAFLYSCYLYLRNRLWQSA